MTERTLLFSFFLHIIIWPLFGKCLQTIDIHIHHKHLAPWRMRPKIFWKVPKPRAAKLPGRPDWDRHRHRKTKKHRMFSSLSFPILFQTPGGFSIQVFGFEESEQFRISVSLTFLFKPECFSIGNSRLHVGGWQLAVWSHKVPRDGSELQNFVITCGSM